MFVVVTHAAAQGSGPSPGTATSGDATGDAAGEFTVQAVSAHGRLLGEPRVVTAADLAAQIRRRSGSHDADLATPGPSATDPTATGPSLRTSTADAAGTAAPRWVFERSVTALPPVLAADPDLRTPHLHDLRLVQSILLRAHTAPGSGVSYRPVLEPLPASQHPGIAPEPPVRSVWNGPGEGQLGLFDAAPSSGSPGDRSQPAERIAPAVAELGAQIQAIDNSRAPEKLRLLAALESTGALLAADMNRVGIPWDSAVHRRLLEEALGPEPAPNARPSRMGAAARHLREILAAPSLNPDSPQSLLRGLTDAGVPVDSTNQWLLKGWVEAAPASTPGERARREALIEPVLEYKKMSRLLTANGWHWLENWVREDRFHAEYVVGGVVTGRWAARGGGALQIPKVVRSAVRPGPGRKLVVADAAQLEPRVLAVLARDDALADASRGRDLYLSVAEQGRARHSGLTERSHAKVALLGAMYGATTGDSGRLVPQLTRLFPKAVAYVEHAAAVGERGEQVCTWLGRWSPAPDERWLTTVADTATADGERRARSMRRSQGRFTRNFVVQGSAAEWAMAWMERIRSALKRETLDADLVFFLHDEIMVDTDATQAPRVEDIVRAAAVEATRMVFGAVPVEFPVTVATVDSYDQAK